MKTKLKLFVVSVLAPMSIFFAVITGCGDDTITSGPPVIDTGVVNVNNIVIQERIPPFETSLSTVDLYHGRVLTDTSTIKDAVLIDSLGMSENFYFRSGDLSALDLPPGFQARFKDIFEYTDITQAQFDTVVTRIPDSDSNLTPSDFGLDQTKSFRAPLPSHRVFGFYLAGRYPGYAAKQVFGVMYLDSAWRENGVFKIRIDIKINKNGENIFAKNSAITLYQ